MTPDITVAIPTYNRLPDLRRCLASLATQTGVTFETVVVDDGGTDGTAAALALEFPDVVVRRHERQMGPGYARNVALRTARAPIVLFLDSDTRMREPGTLARVVGFFAAHGDAGSVGGELAIYRPETTGQVFGRSIAFNGDSGAVSCPDQTGAFVRCDFLATCCCAVRLDVARKVGGFDPYFGFGGEDKDFGDRIARSGYTNYVSADCAVEHHHSPRGRATDETYRYQRTRLMYLCKNRTDTALFTACAYWLAVAGSHLIQLPVRAAVATLRGRRLTRDEVAGSASIVRGMLDTLVNRSAIRQRQHMDFLADDQMRAFAAPQQTV